MNLYLKYDAHIIIEILLRDLLELLGISYQSINAYKIKIDKTEEETIEKLTLFLQKYKIEILKDPEEQIIEQIKYYIKETIKEDSTQNISEVLTEKMEFSYAYLAKLFKQKTLSTIEKYTVLERIEKVKELAMKENLSLTEIAYSMNYSSVAHLSKQFKNCVGMNFQDFLEIIDSRKKEEF